MCCHGTCWDVHILSNICLCTDLSLPWGAVEVGGIAVAASYFFHGVQSVNL
eukprot:c56868_g1_i1 orf=171-323(-)